MSNVAFFQEVLRRAVEGGASDIHIGAGIPIRLRLKGRLEPLQHAPLKACDTLELAVHVLQAAGRIPAGKTDETARALRDEDCAYGLAGVGRFRVNLCVQRGSVAMVLRAIPSTIPTIDDLGLP